MIQNFGNDANSNIVQCTRCYFCEQFNVNIWSSTIIKKPYCIINYKTFDQMCNKSKEKTNRILMLRTTWIMHIKHMARVKMSIWDNPPCLGQKYNSTATATKDNCKYQRERPRLIRTTHKVVPKHTFPPTKKN